MAEPEASGPADGRRLPVLPPEPSGGPVRPPRLPAAARSPWLWEVPRWTL
jgi:hypothetical protein